MANVATRSMEIKMFSKANASMLLEDSNTLNVLADKAFRRFNGTDPTSRQWYPYFWNLSRSESREGFGKLAEAVLSNPEGRVATVTIRGKPAGFAVVTGFGIFLDAQEKMGSRAVEKSEDYADVNKLLKRYEKTAAGYGVRLEQLSYFADIAVARKVEGRGVGTALVRTSIVEVRSMGKEGWMAWTVQPAMAHILAKEGATEIPRLGRTGKGIDFAVQESTGMIVPTVSAPDGEHGKAVARHFIFVGLQRS